MEMSCKMRLLAVTPVTSDYIITSEVQHGVLGLKSGASTNKSNV